MPKFLIVMCISGIFATAVESRENTIRHTAISIITQLAHEPSFFQVKFDLITKSATFLS